MKNENEWKLTTETWDMNSHLVGEIPTIRTGVACDILVVSLGANNIERDAIANLATAAPELFEACKAILEKHEFGSIVLPSKQLGMVQSALAKANGKDGEGMEKV